MPIIDKFKDMGTVVMGKVEAGSIREGDSLVVMPNKVLSDVFFSFRTSSPAYCFLDDFHESMQEHVKVVAIYCDEDKVKRAGPGENLRVRITGIEDEDILSGFVLSSIGKCDALQIAFTTSEIFFRITLLIS